EPHTPAGGRVQALLRPRRGRRSEPGGAAGYHLRNPGAQRRRKVHHAAHGDEHHHPRRGAHHPAGRGPGKGPLRAAPHRLPSRRAGPVQEDERAGGDRLLRPDQGRGREDCPARGGRLAGADGAGRLARGKGGDALQGDAAEGAVHRHRHPQARAADPGRAPVRPGPGEPGGAARHHPPAPEGRQDGHLQHPQHGPGGAALRARLHHRPGPQGAGRAAARRAPREHRQRLPCAVRRGVAGRGGVHGPLRRGHARGRRVAPGAAGGRRHARPGHRPQRAGRAADALRARAAFPARHLRDPRGRRRADPPPGAGPCL
ncbi:MAG: ABC transporter, ATP-binding protein, partial [uncultured Gemmatimonadetes bacterium]